MDNTLGLLLLLSNVLIKGFHSNSVKLNAPAKKLQHFIRVHKTISRLLI